MKGKISEVAENGIEGIAAFILIQIAKGVYGKITENINRKIKTAFSKKELENVKINVAKLSKVKTILYPDKITELHSIYYPKAIKFGGSYYDDIYDFGVKKLLIEGGPGQGKSLYTRRLCIQESKKNRFIPIFIEFRSINHDASFKQELLNSINLFGLNIDNEVFGFLAKSGGLLLILDGFDEIPNASKNSTANELDNLAKSYPELNMVISSRPNSGINNSYYFHQYKIDPLNLNNQIKFVEFIYNKQEVCQDIIALLESGSYITEVTTSPLTLTLFIITYHARQFEPDNITEFYRLVFPTMLYRHDRTKLGFKRERLSGLSDYQMEKIFGGHWVMRALGHPLEIPGQAGKANSFGFSQPNHFSP